MHERFVAEHEFELAMHLGGGVMVQSKIVRGSGNHPKTYITKAEYNGFQITAPVAVFDYEAASINAKVGGSANVDYGRANKLVKNRGILTGPVIAG